MPHIHNEPGQHDHTATAWIVRTDGDEPQLLLHVHKKIGKLLCPGGHVELTENPWQAIQHEIAEETGYDFSQLKLLQPTQSFITQLPGAVVHPVSFCHSTHGFDLWPDHFHTDTAYAFVTDELPANQPAAGESTELRWLTIKDLESIPESVIVENIRVLGLLVLTDLLKNWVVTDFPE